MGQMVERTSLCIQFICKYTNQLYSIRNTFEWKLRIPKDILFTVALRGKIEIFPFQNLKKILDDMYESAMEAMTTRQIKAITYHDWKVCNVIEGNTKVYVQLPRSKRKKNCS